MITLNEAILHAEKEAEESENVVNTGTFKDGWTVAEMYCDDTECIEAHLSRCAKYAEEHRQLAEWLKDYKRLLEQEPCDDAISRAEAILQIQRHGVGCFDSDEFSPEQAERFVINMLNELPSVNPQLKIEQEPFMNKPCVAHQVCHEDKVKVLDKIRAEIEKEYLAEGHPLGYWDGIDKCLKIIDKYRAESEDEE